MAHNRGAFCNCRLGKDQLDGLGVGLDQDLVERDPKLVGPVRRSLGALDDGGTRVELLGLHAPDAAGRVPGDVPHHEEVVAEGPDPPLISFDGAGGFRRLDRTPLGTFGCGNAGSVVVYLSATG
jgi:hypothetical protein